MLGQSGSQLLFVMRKIRDIAVMHKHPVNHRTKGWGIFKADVTLGLATNMGKKDHSLSCGY